MSDGGGRKTPKGFEPPPWERERFEELARRRAEEQAAAEAAARSAAQAAEAAVTVLPAPPAQPAAVSSPAPAEVVPAPAAVAPAGKGLDDTHVQAMLIDLSVEEPSGARGTKQLAIGVSLVLALLSLGMVVMGIALATRASDETSLGLLGGATLVVFGLFFAGLAVWLWVSSRRGRGD